ncbi:ankyrin repeat and SOCS box protein 8 [Lingula anatina]|uniref:Ankyrin repeat and SOCS box protein 8 n=1 Tax=Lingula anatina TaxID=7574 RepID=A0A1S3J726_LINAN|nr:ankyrin repeat and SOCS box protein 8 [Lingula anatina]|eukprot:XP_013406217.1 ankyrin repeat and SOCS box protein 8 [Lingula anatina]
MWYIMDSVQRNYQLSERLVRAISDWATLAPSSDSVEQLIHEGADVNKPHGTLLPLHCACMVSDSYVVELLLQHGAQVNSIDGYGRAALHYAVERDITCTEILLDHNAHPDIPDNNQDTPLHWAAFKNQVQCLEALLQRGARVNAVDYNNDTPLSWAAMKGNYEALAILLEYNADVDTVNFSGRTPILRCAAMQASGLDTHVYDQCLDLLLKASGKIDLRDPQGNLPRIVEGDNKLRELMLEYCEKPRPLQELCRYAVRKSLGTGYIPNVIPKLPLPSRLQDYLLLGRQYLRNQSDTDISNINVV